MSAICGALLLAACSPTPVRTRRELAPEKIYSRGQGGGRVRQLREGGQAVRDGSRGARPAPRSRSRRRLERAYASSGRAARRRRLCRRSIVSSSCIPTSPAFDYALYLRGLVNFNDDLGFLGTPGRPGPVRARPAGDARDAYQSWKQLVEQFPQSPYADDARLRMNYIVNSLAAYEVHVAAYYFRRGAYVAAANRAKQAVQDFQQSPSTEEALFIMAQSYDRLGLTQLRDDARARPEAELSEHQALTSPAWAWQEVALVAALVGRPIRR